MGVVVGNRECWISSVVLCANVEFDNESAIASQSDCNRMWNECEYDTNEWLLKFRGGVVTNHKMRAAHKHTHIHQRILEAMIYYYHQSYDLHLPTWVLAALLVGTAACRANCLTDLLPACLLPDEHMINMRHTCIQASVYVSLCVCVCVSHRYTEVISLFGLIRAAVSSGVIKIFARLY